MEVKYMEVFCFFTDGKQQKGRELDMITHDPEGPWDEHEHLNGFEWRSRLVHLQFLYF